MLTNHLLLKIAELEIQLVCIETRRQEECFSSVVDSVFEWSLVNDSLASTAYIY